MPFYVVLKKGKLLYITEDPKEALNRFLADGDKMESLDTPTQLVSLVNSQVVNNGAEAAQQLAQEIMNFANSLGEKLKNKDILEQANKLFADFQLKLATSYTAAVEELRKFTEEKKK
jgi:hypothetical protein